MKHHHIIATLLVLASCRSTRVVESNTSIADSIAYHNTSQQVITQHDTIVVTRNTQSSIVHTTLDTAGRVRTVTRVITRTITDASSGTHRAQAITDTTHHTRSTHTQSHTTQSPPSPHSSTKPLLIAFMLLLVICYFTWKQK